VGIEGEVMAKYVIPRRGEDALLDQGHDRMLAALSEYGAVPEWEAEATKHGLSLEEYVYRIIAWRLGQFGTQTIPMDAKFEDIGYEDESA
jgi:hypothetical protein